MKLPPFKGYPLILRIVLMFSLLVVFMSVASYAAFLSIHSLFGVEKPEEVVKGIFTSATDRYAFLYVQAISSLGGFLLAALAFSVLESFSPAKHLRLNVLPSLLMLVLAVAAVIIVQFFVEFLVEVNSKLPLPAGLGNIDEHQKEIEELTKRLLDFKDLPTLLVTSIVMAVIPAVSEEFFFRGLLLGDMLKSRFHPVISIVLSGLFFAVFHFEFNNTLAIWVLGSFLGYLYYVSGSLWLPIAAHFINNFFAVLLKYLFNIGVLSSDLAEASSPWYLTLASVILFSGCAYLFYRWRKPDDFYEPEYETEVTEHADEE
ncbi:MAG: CPBP family intramembrane metalloprotease [Chitinophagales bacterium]|nr:CPBP family intramembrane metalloprotease [Chitinophagales bacterium]